MANENLQSDLILEIAPPGADRNESFYIFAGRKRFNTHFVGGNHLQLLFTKCVAYRKDMRLSVKQSTKFINKSIESQLQFSPSKLLFRLQSTFLIVFGTYLLLFETNKNHRRKKLY